MIIIIFNNNSSNNTNNNNNNKNKNILKDLSFDVYILIKLEWRNTRKSINITTKEKTFKKLKENNFILTNFILF